MTKKYSDNDWTKKDLSQKNLRGSNFKGKNLEGFNFEKSDIRGTDFTDANLKNANFKGAIAGLEPRWAIAFLSILFALALLLVICLVIAGQIAGDRMIPKPNLGIYPDVYWEELWVAGIIVFMFGVFVINIIKNQLGTAFQVTFFLGVIVVSLRFINAGVQFILQVPFRNITVSLTSSILASGIGFGIGIIAVLLAIIISMTKIIGLRFTHNVLLIVIFLSTLPTTLFLYKSGAHIISCTIGGCLAFCGIFLGNYIAICAFSEEKKEEKKYPPVLDFAIYLAAVGGTNFYKADLTNANFTKATLKNTDFSHANLTLTRWRNAKHLDLIRSGTTYLKNTQVRNLLVTGKGRNQNFDRYDLRSLDLCGADLENTSFIDADFYKANLQGANLSGAILVRAQFERANLANACLTGSCIQDWIITRTTNLNEIVCEYIYLSFNGKDKIDMMPPRGHFNSGEFILFIQTILETIDIYHDKNINPKLALSVLKKLSKDYDEPLDVVAIGKRGESTFIKVRVPKNIDPEKIKKEYYNMYNQGNSFFSKTYEALPIDKNLEDKITQVALSKERDEDSASIHVSYIEYFYNNKGQFVTGGQASMNHYELNNPKFGGGFAGTGGTSIGGTFYDYSSNIDYSSKQNLAEAAVEIQQLLTQLQNQGNTQEEAQQKVANDLAKQAQNNPTVKEKLTKWGLYVKDASASGLIGEAAVVVIKLALGFAGIPLP